MTLKVPFPLTLVTLAGLLLTVLLFASPALARDQIQVVGSSTVFPFSTAVAEEFGRTTDFRTPVVERTGSGGGLKLFCSGIGLQTPDITNASRRIKASEVALCETNGVRELVEVRIGFDGIVIANAKASTVYAFSKEEIFRALAKEVPVQGKLVPNPYEKWSDINPALPEIDLSLIHI